MATKRSFWERHSLRVPSDGRTRAAELTLRQSIYPLCLVTVLFFLWGFSYGLLDTLNKHFQNTLNISKARSSGLQAAYFGAYPLASLGHAAWILRHFGYRAVFIWGLFLYGLGALLAIPAIIYHSFGAFCACIFIIGNGLGSLETAANPYLTVCGPPHLSEIRINIAQAFNAIGTVVAPVLGSYVFFVFDEEVALKNVQWVYMAIACFVFILAIIFYLSDIPEITDADMELQASQTHGTGDNKPLRKQYRLFHATFAQFCYTGAQVAIAGYFINYLTETRPSTSSSLASKFLAGAQAAFALGRFFGTGLMSPGLLRPRKVLLAFMTLCIVFTAPAITQRDNTGMSLLYVTFFFESICFPTIVALGMRGLGRHTKRGSGFIIGGVVGGAVAPALMGLAADARGTAFAMVVPLGFFVAAWSYPLAVNVFSYYKDAADAFVTAPGVGDGDDGAVGGSGGSDEEKGGVVTERRAEKAAG
ncbi:major facilitator superfamily domain-containing protein [Cercophora scortea]|uniref:Major facilitator superfamily domain-containing protein n=1 Tax=Cercophora scortea TaxID=314031 RepID=A0AAE0M4D4_9PEZI|nr:major facilitator superfamily domain-containing protein [Cercophora scortea]